jgi:hypothetical protein
VSRAALLIVPFADIGVGGSSHVELIGSLDADVKATEFGIPLGTMIFL